MACGQQPRPASRPGTKLVRPCSRLIADEGYNEGVAKAPTVADLRWAGALTFAATTQKSALIIDSNGVDGPSPVDALAVALAGCMSVDVTDILSKGRHELRSLESRLVADRAPDDPHRFVRVALHFTIGGPVPADAVNRAIALSRNKYCSVWHSMRQDIDFTVTWQSGTAPV
jgi:putative redox protein